MFKHILIMVLVTMIGAMLAVAPAARAQTTWYVDDDAPDDPGPGDPTISDPLEDGSPEHPFDAIQEGIDAASDGDTVLVLDGTYTGVGNKNLDFGGKAITVRSQNGAETCVIDCEHDGRGFYFHNDETTDAILDGFTITRGEADYGGAIRCGWSDPRITNCVIVGNRARGGGGIWCTSDNATFRDCVISDNTAYRAYQRTGGGGGIRLNSYAATPDDPQIINCVISGNSAAGWGGGVFCYEYAGPLKPAFEITNCVITENSAAYGGGIGCWHADPIILDCEIVGNECTDCGGGICAWMESAPTVVQCTISANTTTNAEYPEYALGGGAHCNQGSLAVFTSCRILQNWADGGGGGLRCVDYADVTLLNCLVGGNRTAGRGGGISCDHWCAPLVTNCVIVANVAEDGGGLDGGTSGDNAATATNCVVFNNAPDNVHYEYGNPLITYCNIQGSWPGHGNIDADPLFVDPDGPDDDPNTFEDNDYRLTAGSPCIDAGDNTAVPADVLDLDGDGDTEEPIPFDLDSNPRFVDDPGMPDSGNGAPPIVDMGAYEFQGQTCFGDLDGDDDIDLTDLASLLSNYGTTSGAVYTDGDLDRDTDVDLTDLAALLAVYGTSCP